MRLLGFRDGPLDALPAARERDPRAGLLHEDAGVYAELVERLAAGDARLHPWIGPLSRGQACVVLTGQQPALLGGPLYTLYKAWTAIETARRLRAAGTPAIAAYWCVGDDTDHDEVRNASWPLRTGAPRRVRDEQEAGGRRIGSLEQERMADALAALSNDAPAVAGLGALERAKTAQTWSGFLEEALKSLAGDEPLLFVDGNDPALLRAAQPWLARMAGERKALAREIAVAAERLRAEGVVPGLEGEEAERGLFVAEGDRRVALEIDRDPAVGMTLLPNVVLRPALQEHLLSVERVICGAGEIAYRRCLDPVYERTGRPAAPLARRFEATLFPPPWGAADQVPDAAEVLASPDLALDAWGGRFADAHALTALTDARAAISARLAHLGEPLTAADRSLGQVLDSAAGKIDYQLQRIEDALRSKGRTALLRRYPVLANLREFLLPRGRAQERSFTMWTPFLWEGSSARGCLDTAVKAWFDRGGRGHALLTLDEGGR
jgi:bacillithiol synthase